MVDSTIYLNGVNINQYMADVEPTITITEGSGKTAVFTLLIDVLNPNGLALKPTDEIAIDLQGTRAFLGKVLAFEPAEEVIHVTASDNMAELSGKGSNYFYTHYQSRVTDERVADGYDTSVTPPQLYLQLPESGLTINTGDALYAVNNAERSNISGASSIRPPYDARVYHNGGENGGGYVLQRFKAQEDVIYAISWRLQQPALLKAITADVVICADDNGSVGAEIYRATHNVNRNNGDVWWDINFGNDAINVSSGSWYWFKVDNASTDGVSGSVTGMIGYYTYQGTLESGSVCRVYGNYGLINADWRTVTYGSERGLHLRIFGANYHTITNGSVVGNRYNIHGIEGVPSFDSSIRQPVFRRGLITYYYGEVLIKSILQMLLDAHGYVLDTYTGSTKALLNYRCRGAYLTSYIDDLTGLLEPEGYQTVISSSLSELTTLIQKRRKSIADPADATFEYGVGDFMAFVPSKTIINRPAVAFIRAEVKDPQAGTPAVVMVSAVDLSDKMYSSESMEDSNMQNAVDAISQAYALLDDIQRNLWEGTLTLTGLHADLIDNNPQSDTYGSGKILHIKDPRYFIDEKLKVKSITLDADQMTTKVVLSNVSLTNDKTSNLDKNLNQTQSTVLSSGDEHGYLCLLRKDLNSNNNDATTMAIYNGTTLLTSVSCTIIDAPRYRTRTYHAFFPVGQGTISTPHGVTRLVITNPSFTWTIDLRPSQQQDKYAEQDLTIDLVVNRTA